MAEDKDTHAHAHSASETHTTEAPARSAVAEPKAPPQPKANVDAPDSGRRDAQGRKLDAKGEPIVETGAGGSALPNQGEHGGGAIKDELRPDPPDTTRPDPLWKQKRYIASRLGKEAGSIIGRPPEEIGLWGKGDTYHGIGILINVDTLEKVRVYDDWKFEGDEVFANTRDLPHALTSGDVAGNLKG